MDPTKCLEAMWDAEDFDPKAYNGYKADLIEWLDRGGFGPMVTCPYGCGKAQLVKLTWTSDATIKFANGKTRVCRLRELGLAS